MTTLRLLFGNIWRGAILGTIHGLWMGALYGAVFLYILLTSVPTPNAGIGFAILLAGASIYGGITGIVFGAITGLITGTLDGLLIGILTRVFFFPLNRDGFYRPLIEIFSGLFVAIASMQCFIVIWRNLFPGMNFAPAQEQIITWGVSIIPSFIAGVAAFFSTHRLSHWNQVQMEKRTP